MLNIGPLFCVLGCDIALTSSGYITSLGTKLRSYILYIGYYIIYIYLYIHDKGGGGGGLSPLSFWQPLHRKMVLNKVYCIKNV